MQIHHSLRKISVSWADKCLTVFTSWLPTLSALFCCLLLGRGHVQWVYQSFCWKHLPTETGNKADMSCETELLHRAEETADVADNSLKVSHSMSDTCHKHIVTMFVCFEYWHILSIYSYVPVSQWLTIHPPPSVLMSQWTWRDWLSSPPR